jgi:hypothetical protein
MNKQESKIYQDALEEKRKNIKWSINQHLMDLNVKDKERLDEINQKLYRNEFKSVDEYMEALEENSKIFRVEMFEVLNKK